MPDILDAKGLTLKTSQEIQEEIENGFRSIYGEQINLDPDTPDGQQVALLQQLSLDIREVIQQVYSSFDPDQAVGTVLDQRVSINNIQRIQGAYTIVPVQITRSESGIKLNGLDTYVNDPDGGNNAFTISDNAGNKFYLLTTDINAIAGVRDFKF